MLQFTRCSNQVFTRIKAAARRLRRDQVWDDLDDARVVRTTKHALGARQVVIEEGRVGEGAADVAEEAQQLVVVQRAPGRQGDLESAKPRIVGDSQTLDDRRRRESNHADHGADAGLGGRLPEDAYDTLEARGVDGISFATCPEDVDVAEARGEDEPNFLSE